MADNHNKRQQGIESLLAERKKYETWLAQLDTKRASTPDHVFVRVHSDYTKRLDDVRGRLADEADGIKALVSDLETQLATQQRLVTEKTDERAELELRATVGEFSEKEWNTTRSKLDAAIDEIRSKFETTESELTEMREVLQSVESLPAAAPEPEPTPEPTPEPASEPSPEPARPAPPAAAPAPRARTPFDELAFLKSVAGTPTTPTPMPAVPAVPPQDVPLVAAKSDVTEVDAPSAAEPEVTADPEIAPFADPEPVAAAEPEVMAEPSFEVEPEPSFGTEQDEEPAPRRSRPSSKTPSSDSGPLGAPTPRTSQAIRSLKCQECDTLNFPTEWYCERCGGELAAF